LASIDHKDRERGHGASGLGNMVLMQLFLTLSTGYYFYFVTFGSFGQLQMDAKAISYEGQSVSEAAAELGFSDIKNVSRTFRQLKGITPSEYREQFAPKRR